MPVQKFAPMTKELPSFDCDAHVTEPLGYGNGPKTGLAKMNSKRSRTASGLILKASG
jgi:hypothetical protein